MKLTYMLVLDIQMLFDDDDDDYGCEIVEIVMIAETSNNDYDDYRRLK